VLLLMADQPILFVGITEAGQTRTRLSDPICCLDLQASEIGKTGSAIVGRRSNACTAIILSRVDVPRLALR